jgi:hypothetical protein
MITRTRKEFLLLGVAGALLFAAVELYTRLNWPVSWVPFSLVRDELTFRWSPHVMAAVTLLVFAAQSVMLLSNARSARWVMTVVSSLIILMFVWRLSSFVSFVVEGHGTMATDAAAVGLTSEALIVAAVLF